MSIFDDMFKEDEKITEELYAYLPEEREEALRNIYGRNKEEFPWIDFGDDTKGSSADYDYDDEDEDDFDEDDFDEDNDFDTDDDF